MDNVSIESIKKKASFPKRRTALPQIDINIINDRRLSQQKIMRFSKRSQSPQPHKPFVYVSIKNEGK